LHTGDFGYLDEEGFLYFAGRQAHWIRCRGENVSAYEVESILSQHDFVQESAVVGVSSDLGEEDIKAFVILKEGTYVSPQDLIAWCAERLAKFKIPRYIVYCDDFPRSAAKREIERHKLKAGFFEDVFDHRNSPLFK
jgi:crotonobetaine/carnitine-CoA ligase